MIIVILRISAILLIAVISFWPLLGRFEAFSYLQNEDGYCAAPVARPANTPVPAEAVWLEPADNQLPRRVALENADGLCKLAETDARRTPVAGNLPDLPAKIALPASTDDEYKSDWTTIERRDGKDGGVFVMGGEWRERPNMWRGWWGDTASRALVPLYGFLTLIAIAAVVWSEI